MTDNVVDLNVITTLDLNPDRLLSKAIGQLDRVLIIGIDKAGAEYFASSIADGGSVLWDIERAKHNLMKLADASIA
ncbi:hypothetical protein NKJ04_17350 [Mesorhizobium sp. M0618]|uniref:hypothetical protein n=1 Tax=Mesorhizobium sp. M0618 TaxID=2956972 RepID=UPI0033371E8F